MVRWLAVLGILFNATGACYATCGVRHCSTVVTHHAPVVVATAPVVVKEIISTLVTPVVSPILAFPLPVQVQSYSSAYVAPVAGVAGVAGPQGFAPQQGYAQPPPVASAAPANGMAEVMSELRKISAGVAKIEAEHRDHTARLDAIERRLGQPKIEAPPIMPKADEAPTPKGVARITRLSVAQAKCASCHSASNAATKGGDFVILATPSTLAPLTVVQEKAILVRTDGEARNPMPPRASGVEALSDDEHAAWVRRVD